MDNMKVNVNRRTYKGPITSCSYYNQSCFLIGHGPYLSAIDSTTLEKLNQIEILKYRVIHGIILHGTLICVYGQKSFNICSYSSYKENTFTRKRTDLRELDDWIWTIEWLDDSHLGIVCAHNQFIVYNLATDTIDKSITCTEKSMLYSAKILKPNSTQTYIASGTVYNEVLIWSPANEGEILCRLRAHDGVIFNIGFDVAQSLLYSVSDDRSIIIWNLDFTNLVDSKIYTKFYGHDARVWKCEWLHIGTELYLCSIGEDLKCCLWNVNERKLTYRFNAIRKGSKNIWSLMVNELDLYLITGWGDGGLRRYELKNYLINTPVIEAEDGIEASLVYDSDDFPKTIQLLKSRVFSCTNNGHVYMSGFDSEHHERVFTHDSLKTYNCMTKLEVNETQSYLAVGSLYGQIFLFYDFDCDQVKIKTVNCDQLTNNRNAKIFSLIWHKSEQTDRCYLLASLTFLNGMLHLYELDTNKNELNLVACLTLPNCKHRWVTGYTFCRINSDTDEDVLVCGDKCGNLHVYEPLNATNEPQPPKQTLNQVANQGLAITSIYYKNDLIVCCSRDGFYRLFKFNDDDTCQLVLVNKFEINSCIDFIESFTFHCDLFANQDTHKLFTLEQNILLALCFYGDKFLLWSFYLNRSLAEVKCGGAKRSWDYEFWQAGVDTVSIEFKFIYIKQKSFVKLTKKIHLNELYTGFTSLNTNHLLQTFHGNSIACCAYFGDYLITGSEDTQIIVTNVPLGSVPVTHDFYLQGHDSVVKCLCQMRLNDRECLLLTAGGKANIKLWKLISNQNKIEKVEQICEFKRFNKSKSGKCVQKPWLYADLQANPDIRLMDVDVARLDDETFILYFACSDGYTRLFKYFLATNKIHIIDEYPYDRCMLCIKYIELTQTDSYLLCTATDGHLIVHKLKDKLLDNQREPTLIKNLHQSGVNSFDTRIDENDRVVVASVGDDTRLSVVELDLNKNELDCHRELIKVDMAHASSIMGVKFIEGPYLATVSKDQRLIIWECNFEANEIIAIKVYFSNVMDISTMAIRRISHKKYQTVVIGCGFELFEINLEE